ANIEAAADILQSNLFLGQAEQSAVHFKGLIEADQARFRIGMRENGMLQPVSLKHSNYLFSREHLTGPTRTIETNLLKDLLSSGLPLYRLRKRTKKFRRSAG